MTEKELSDQVTESLPPKTSTPCYNSGAEFKSGRLLPGANVWLTEAAALLWDLGVGKDPALDWPAAIVPNPSVRTHEEPTGLAV